MTVTAPSDASSSGDAVHEADVLILGAGLAGLSASWFIGHARCVLLEQHAHAFGHIASRQVDGFTWDEGPHVSFTQHALVRDLFAEGVQGAYEEYPVRTVNWWKGHWIDHPAQSNLYQMPVPMRDACLASFLGTRTQTAPDPEHYGHWLEQAFGPVFAEEFPAAYTRKYWTTSPEDLTTDWVGSRVFRPRVEDVVQGAEGPLPQQTHYIRAVRYPSHGGYQSFAAGLAADARIQLNQRVVAIDLESRIVTTHTGQRWRYQTLINTLPLPIFVDALVQSDAAMREDVAALTCSQLLLVQVTAPHPTRVPGNWFYVYDESMLSTRIHCVETLSPNSAPAGHTGVQVEVYASRYRPFGESFDAIGQRVAQELATMGFIDGDGQGGIPANVQVSTHFVPWANVVFDHPRRPALQRLLRRLEAWGLVAEHDALEPTTDWAHPEPPPRASLYLAGRFGQWKYYWTDDCVLRGKAIADSLARTP